jgi:PAS domain S-box-containing protein
MQKPHHASADNYRELFHAIDVGFCIMQLISDDGAPPDFLHLETNPAFAVHTGLSGAEGKTMRELVPDHEEAFLERYAAVARGGEPARYEYYVPAVQRWFDIYAFPVGQRAERKIAVLFTDITLRKRAEEALRTADRRKDEFIATLSHELRNPLAPIRNCLYILERVPSGSEQAQRALSTINRQAEQLVRLVDDLLDVVRITKGKSRLSRDKLDLALLMRQAAEDYQHILAAQGIRFEVDIPREPCPVLGDATRLVQTAGNLLGNAAKFTSTGGRVRLALATEGGEAVVTVADDGPGIEPALLETLFEPFAQAEQPSARGRGGLGLGLALVKGFVEMHGGRVTAASQGPGTGATFTVRLPLAT